MFLKLAHNQSELYQLTKRIISDCYILTKKFPGEEKFNLLSQIRRAAISVLLNLSEGASRKSEKERKRFYEVARGSLIELDAALDVSIDLKYILPDDVQVLGVNILSCFKILTAMIKTLDISISKIT